MSVRVDVGNVQGNVVRTYRKTCGRALYVFFEVTDLAQARPLIIRWLDEVTFGDPVRAPAAGNGADSDAVFVNLAFTYDGLDALQLRADVLDRFPCEFRKGAEDRAEGLGDHWDKQDGKLPLKDAHLMVSVHSPSDNGIQSGIRRLDLDKPGNGLQRIHGLCAGYEDSKHPRERFRFADGLSQPAIEGVDIDPVGDGAFAGVHPRGPGLRRQAGLMLEDLGLRPLSRTWRLIRAGEFLLGYENEDGDLPTGSDAPLGPDSTFMVYREIDQFPTVFDDYIKKEARRLEIDREALGAKIVGRWRNGTPAIRHHRESNGVADNRRRSNDFLYSEDPQGFGCPLGAHARRANPRDALPGGAEQTMRHRIIRRGMPYEHVNDAYGKNRQGLAFVCFSSSIANGFEFIQKNWINDGRSFGLGKQADFLLQEKELPTQMVIPGFRPAVLDAPAEPFVKVRGCAYLFVPSRSACSWLRGFLMRT